MSMDVLASEQLVELAPRLETYGGFAIIGSGNPSLINIGLGLLGGVGVNNGVNYGGNLLSGLLGL